MRRLQLVLIGTLLVITLMVVYANESSAESLNQTFPTSDIPPSIEVDEGTFNLQIQAIEITQGVRGEIPTRHTPEGDLVLPPDGAVHIANRRTIVRAYPWVENKTGTALPPVTARLWAYRDGELLPESPISPQNALLYVSADWNLETMRSDSGKSWNFVLPSNWSVSDSQNKSFSLRFVVEVNPGGPNHQSECLGCEEDNQVSLNDQDFLIVPTLVIQPYFVEHTVTDLKNEQVTYPGPTQQEFETVINSVHSMLPIGDPGHGLTILPPKFVEWQGPLYENESHVFPDAMIEQYLPNGELKADQNEIIHIFVFTAASNHDFLVYNNSGGTWLGLAWIGKPYAQCAGRQRDMIHELTHAIGLSHAGNQNGETTTNAEYPDANGKIESTAYGFDIWEIIAVPPVSEAGQTHDYMSYNSTDPFWVSVYTWEAVANLLGQPNLDV